MEEQAKSVAAATSQIPGKRVEPPKSKHPMKLRSAEPKKPSFSEAELIRAAAKQITQPAIGRLALRAGVTSKQSSVVDMSRCALAHFLRGVIRKADHCREADQRKRIHAKDVVRALQEDNHIIYGFGNPFR